MEIIIKGKKITLEKEDFPVRILTETEDGKEKVYTIIYTKNKKLVMN